MTEKEVCLSSKNQIVIPKEIREAVHLKTNDRLCLTVSSGGSIMLWKKPKNYTKYLERRGENIWKGIDIDKYVETIRREWE
ncbi:hypothetical protein A2310_07795 [candidate division WOR-1 bacterium RIFOXYB2_FULL_37_13]|uniref:SpoVT-AbrB domain-containing protein n=1 Tax=candidate division WOR-1 bacterium RIFOXYB2_FULL_37_13 TaxID=1802579 RepID=A0A1F4SQC1_UNCSA|nr:MAG: hypothetical protein A2310_07795 [candidate division WOR-1 bacterium RIFOXYB2_FULL_37_13]